MDTFRPAPSARLLAWGIALVAFGQFLSLLAVANEASAPAVLGAIAGIAGLVALGVGVYRLASGVDFLARRAAEKRRTTV